MLAPLTPEQVKRDSDHLQLLAIFHFVMAGLGFLGMGFLVVHYFLMSTVMDNQQMWDRVREQQAQRHQSAMPFDPHVFFDAFRWFYVLMGVWGIVSIVLNCLSGLFIIARRSRFFSLLVAGFNCINMPFGTVLGVFTIIVLVRDSVLAQYQPRPAGLAPVA